MQNGNRSISMRAGRRRALAGTALGLVTALGAGGGAFAQSDAGGPSTEVGEVVVTATGTNISGVKPVGSEAIALDRSAILATGRTTIADVVRTLPQVQSIGFSETASPSSYGGNAGAANNAATVSGANTTRGTQINVRGLPGNNATLLLVDGHRLAPSGVQTQFQEAIQVPLAALERVEVIADGASAIYGSDAISGVVNFVLRKRFDGLEVTGRYNTNQYGDGWGGSVVFGHGWDRLGGMGEGSLIATYEHSYTAPILRGEIPQLREDLRPFGGIDNRIGGTGTPAGGQAGGFASPGLIGNIVVPAANTINQTLPSAQGNIYYGLPSTSNGLGISAGQLRLNQPNLVDRSDYEDYQPRTVRDQVAAFLRQEINPWLEIYYEGFFTKRDTATRTFVTNNVGGNPFTVQVRPGTPYYIPGIPGANGGPYFVQYNLAEHYRPNGGQFYNDNTETTYTNTVGLKARLPAEWNGEFYTTYGANHACGVCYIGAFVSADAPIFLEQEVNAGRINPYSPEPLTQSQIDRISGSNIQRGHNSFTDAVLKFDGPLFDLPGGKVRAAVGGEYTYQVSKVRNGSTRPCDQFLLGASCPVADNIFRWDAHSRSPRQEWSAFGELYVPLVGQGNAFPLMQELSVDAALRYDRYTDFGSTTNPKIGATWKVTGDLSFRGSWGTSFRAPSQTDIDPGAFSVAVQVPAFPNFSGDPQIINNPPPFPGFPVNFTNVLFVAGGNPDLKPEEGEHWSIGFDLTPRFVQGLKLSGTYYNITYKGRIDSPGVFPGYLLTPTLSYLKPYVTVVQPQAGCVNSDPSTYAPAVRNLLQGNLYGPNTIGFLYGASTITDPCGVRTILDGRLTNLATTRQAGFDISASYTFQTGIGGFTLAGTVNKILKNDEQAAIAATVNEGLDRIFFPVSVRGRGTLSWFNGPVNANLSMNYTGGYLNDLPITRFTTTGQVRDPNQKVPSWTTFDLNLNYQLNNGFGLSPLKDVRASVTIQNLFDKGAPVVLSGTSAADTSKHSILGRTWQFQLTKVF